MATATDLDHLPEAITEALGGDAAYFAWRTRMWESDWVWLTAQDMARLLSSEGDAILPSWLKKRAAVGEIPAHKLPGSNRWRFNPKAVSKAIKMLGREGGAVVQMRAFEKANAMLNPTGRGKRNGKQA